MNDKQDSTAEGAWVFLSHSHRDLDKVRQIRDDLERKGHNPLIFFLKCLEDDGSELPDLLRREIGARTWFILCDSPNARASKWVQEEVQMITSLEGKVFKVVDLSQDVQKELHKVTELSKRATVFLSYSRRDVSLAQRIGDALKHADYRVFVDIDDIAPGSDFQSSIQSALDESLATGFVLVLLSPDAITSQFCRAEVEYALRKEQASRTSNVVPILIRDRTAVFAALPPTLAALQCFDLTSGDFDQRMKELIHSLKTRAME